MQLSKIILLGILFTVFMSACHNKHKTDNKTTDNSTNSNNGLQKGADEDSTASIIESTWYVQSFPLDGKPFNSPKHYAITFDKASVGLKLEVNVCGFGCIITNTHINFKETPMCTEACCDSKEGKALSNLLKGKLAYQRNNNFLTIQTSSGPITMTSKNTSLEQTSWIAQSYTDKKEGVLTKFEKPNVLAFDAQKASLQLDVNRCNSDYKIDQRKQEITISPMGCTRKCCDAKDASMLAQQLNGPIKYQLEDNSLTLQTNSKTFIFKKIQINKE